MRRPPDPEPEAAPAQEQGSAPDDKEPKGARARAMAKKRKRATAVVVKCDLCIDHAEGPACVAACPTKALRVIDQDYLERGMQAKRRAAARATAAFSSIAFNAELDEEG